MPEKATVIAGWDVTRAIRHFTKAVAWFEKQEPNTIIRWAFAAAMAAANMFKCRYSPEETLLFSCKRLAMPTRAEDLRIRVAQNKAPGILKVKPSQQIRTPVMPYHNMTATGNKKTVTPSEQRPLSCVIPSEYKTPASPVARMGKTVTPSEQRLLLCVIPSK